MQGGTYGKPLRYRPKARLLTLDALDGRTKAKRAVKRLLELYRRRVGGRFTPEQELVAEKAAVLSALAADAEVRALGGDTSAAEHVVRLRNQQRRAEEEFTRMERRLKRTRWPSWAPELPELPEIAEEDDAQAET